MNICFITENTYPYTICEISKWISDFITCCPDYEFSTLAIGFREYEKGSFVFKIPDNMINIEEVFLESPFKVNSKFSNKRYIKTSEQRDSLINHLLGNTTDWESIFKFVDTIKTNHIKSFFHSREFYNIVKFIYDRYYPNKPFLLLLNTLKYLYTTQFYILKSKIPSAKIYHCTSSGYSGLLGAYQSYKTNRPLLILEHSINLVDVEMQIIKNNIIEDWLINIYIKHFESMAKCAYKYSKKIIAFNEQNHKLQVKLGAQIDKTSVLPIKIDVKKYIKQKAKKETKSIIIGCVASITPRGDILTLLKAFLIAQKSIPSLRLKILGSVFEDEEYFKQIELFININKLTNIDFIEYTSESQYMELLKIFDIYISIGIDSSQNNILHAMASKIPIICTEAIEYKELILGTNGQYAPAGIVSKAMNYREISDAIILLATNNKVKARMAENGYTRVLSYYSTQNMSEDYKKIYENIN